MIIISRIIHYIIYLYNYYYYYETFSLLFNFFVRRYICNKKGSKKLSYNKFNFAVIIKNMSNYTSEI